MTGILKASVYGQYAAGDKTDVFAQSGTLTVNQNFNSVEFGSGYLFVDNIVHTNIGNSNSSDITIECWIRPKSSALTSGVSDKIIFAQLVPSTGTYQYIVYISNGYLKTTVSYGTTTVSTVTLSSTIKLAADVWTHVAFTKNNADRIHLYQGGLLVDSNVTGSSNASYDTTATKFVVGGSDVTGSNFDGYISNLRVISYTSDPLYLSSTNNNNSKIITPSGEQLAHIPWFISENTNTGISTRDMTTTALLICQNGKTIDNSGLNNIVAVSGTVNESVLSPFIDTSLQSSWSWAFDRLLSPQVGQQSITISNTLIFGDATNSIRTLDFTMECWFYPTKVADPSTTAGGFGSQLCGAAFSNYFTINFYTDNKVYFLANGSVAVKSQQVALLNTWNHVAVVRKSNKLTIYLNGISGESVNNSFDFYTTAAGNNWFSIGARYYNGVQNFSGYISDVRLVKGVGLYSNNFIPPTEPLTAVSGTVLLTAQTEWRLVDRGSWSTNSTVVARNESRHSSFSPYSSSARYTNWSWKFNGTTDYLTMPDSNSYHFSSGNFTIEFWFYASAVTDQWIISQFESAASANTNSNFGIFFNSGKLRASVAYNKSTTTTNLDSTTSIQTDTWYHVALVRNESKLSLYINGTSETSNTVLGTLSTNDSNLPLNIGYRKGNTNYFNGHISNVRIVKGVIYSANFTPSTSPLELTQDTTLLTCNQSIPIDVANTASITFGGSPLPTQISSLNVKTKIYADVQYLIVAGGGGGGPRGSFGGGGGGGGAGGLLTGTTSVNPGTTSVVVGNGGAPATNGSSSYAAFVSTVGSNFNGSASYLSLPQNSEYAAGSKDFTLECWWYITSYSPSGFTPICQSSSSLTVDNGKFLFGWNFQGNARELVFTTHGPSDNKLTVSGSWTPVAGAWYHVCVTRKNGDYNLFVNGKPLTVNVYGATSNAALNLAENGFIVGAAGNGPTYLNGIISCFRYVVGTSLYTQSFTPQFPLTDVGNTKILLAQDSNLTPATFIDYSSVKATVTTVGTVAKINTYSPFHTLGGGRGGGPFEGGTSGGSGGGGGASTDVSGPYGGGVGVLGQGFSGGSSTTYGASGGGGGSDGVGIQAQFDAHGGPGKYISFLESFYAGGGAAGSGTGGRGGGGNPGQAGSANSGSGGGGGNANPSVGGAGGSGIVAVKYVSRITDTVYDKPGTYTYVVPDGVYTVSVVCVGGGGGATDGDLFAGTDSIFGDNQVIGRGASVVGNVQTGGSFVGDGGGSGGQGGPRSAQTGWTGNGGGAGGYAGNGATGTGQVRSLNQYGVGGGGVGIYGIGPSGAGLVSDQSGAGGANYGGAGGSYGTWISTVGRGGQWGGGGAPVWTNTGRPGGGGGGLGWKNNIQVVPGQKIQVVVGNGGRRLLVYKSSDSDSASSGGFGAVRIISGPGRKFPDVADVKILASTVQCRAPQVGAITPNNWYKDFTTSSTIIVKNATTATVVASTLPSGMTATSAVSGSDVIITLVWTPTAAVGTSYSVIKVDASNDCGLSAANSVTGISAGRPIIQSAPACSPTPTIGTINPNSIIAGSTYTGTITVTNATYATVSNLPASLTATPADSVPRSSVFSTGNYLTINYNSSLNLDSGDFTFESWVYPTAATGIYGIYAVSGGGGATAKMVFHLDSRVPKVHFNGLTNGSNINNIANAALITNRWSHIAYVRRSGNWTWYINGVASGTGTNNTTVTFTNQPAYIGYGGESYFLAFSGYIFNLRVVKGVAVYTSDFAVPTSDLTAVTGTTLLTCRGKTFVDSSTTPQTITLVGTPTTIGNTPYLSANYVLNVSGTVTAVTGTAYNISVTAENDCIGGTVSTITATGGSGTVITVDCATPTIGDLTPNSFKANSSYTGTILLTNATGFTISGLPTGNNMTAVGAQNGANHTITITGTPTVELQSYTISITATNTGACTSKSATRTFTGTVAVGDCTLPDIKTVTPNVFATNSTYSGTITVLNGTSGTVSNLPSGITSSGSTTYFARSVRFFGNQYLSTNMTGLALGIGDFTVECWVNFTDTAENRGMWQISTTTGGLQADTNGLALQTFGNNWYFHAKGAAQGPFGTTTTGRWYHTALVRNNGSLSLFVNGSSLITINQDSTSYGSNVAIGGIHSQPYLSKSYISNFRVVRGTALYTSTFVPSLLPSTAISGTTLLTCHRNSILDGSSNNFTITQTGTPAPTVTEISPVGDPVFNKSRSTYFDGTGDYLSLASNAAFSPGTGDFTWEAYIFPTSWASTNHVIYATTATGGLFVGKIGSNFSVRAYGVADQLTHSTLPTLNVWTHVAVARNGTSLKLYYNGVEVASTTNSYNFAQAAVRVGADDGGATYTGYISNLRLVKGTALYTTNFTTPTTPLTAITNTSLLTCNSENFSDFSSNNFTITKFGDTVYSEFSPFNPSTSTVFNISGIPTATQSYNISVSSANACVDKLQSTITGSAGSGNVVIGCVSPTIGTVSMNAFVVGTIYSGTITVTNATSATISGLPIGVTATGAVSGSNYVFTLSGAPTLQTNKQNYNYNIIVVATNSCAGALASTITASAGSGTVGECSLPVIETVTPNSFALGSSYVGTITVNNSTSASITNDTLPAGITATSNSIINKSVSFNGTSDYLTVSNNSSHQFGSSPFTIEGWILTTSTATQGVIGNFQNGVNGWRVILDSTGIGYGAGSNAATVASFSFSSTSNLFTGTWRHFAVVGTGTLVTIYVDGVAGATTGSQASGVTSGGYLSIGKNSDDSGGTTWLFRGYISNLRLVKGTALYTSNFTVPTAPLSAITNTTLLTCNDNTIIDGSSVKNVITTVGSAKAVDLGPFVIGSPNYGVYFDASGDYFSATSSTAFAFGTGDFTVEFWMNSGDVSTAQRGLFQTSTTAGGLSTSYANGLLIVLGTVTNAAGANGALSGGITGILNGVNFGSPSAIISVNTWYHIAVVRNSGVVRLYVNGVSVDPTTRNITSAVTSTNIAIGGYYSGAYLYNGIITNFRVINGVALYTSNFNPPISALSATPQTTFLTCNSTPIRDNSTNNLSITINGDCRISNFSPFGYSKTVFNLSGTPTTAQSYNITVSSTYSCTIGTSSTIIGTAGSGTVSNCLGPVIGSLSNTSFTVDSSYSGTINITRATSASITGLPIGITATGSASGGNYVFTLSGTPTFQINKTNYNYTISVTATNNCDGGQSATSTLVVASGAVTECAPSVIGTLSNTSFIYGSPYNDSLTITNATLATVNTSALPQGITVTGVPYLSRSVLFNGSNTITVTPAVQLSNNSFTIETWIYPRSIGTLQTIMSQWLASGGYPLIIYLNAAGLIVFSVNNSFNGTSTIALTTNQWYHIALTRNVNEWKIFINGKQAYVNTSSITVNSSPNYWDIGRNMDAGGVWNLNAYLSNFRVVLGTALYTSNFNISSTPLTVVSGTELLILNSSDPLKDNSVKNRTLTRTGTFSATEFSPTTFMSYGVFFNGGSYLQCSNNSAFNFGTGDFTIELWVSPQTVPAVYHGIIDTRTASSFLPWYCGLYNVSGTLRIDFVYATNLRITGTTTSVSINTWTHVAISRASGVIRLFVNGVVDATTVNFTGAINSARTDPLIGAIIDPYYLTGHISNLRIVKGTALYTTNFTTPTTPLTVITNTALLTCNSNTLSDASSTNSTITNTGGSFIIETNIFDSTVTRPTGRLYSVYFDGYRDLLNISLPSGPNTLPFRFGTGNFTIEFWQNYNGISGFQTIVSSGYVGGVMTGGWVVQTGSGNGRIIFYYQSATSATAIATESGTTISTGVWYHVAIVKNGTTVTIYRDGVSVGTGTDNNNYVADTGVVIGGGGASAGSTGFTENMMYGYISSLRIVKGIAIYTSAFTPRKTPLTAISGTSLLTCNTNTIRDSSTNNYSITIQGNTTVSTLIPFGVDYYVLNFSGIPSAQNSPSYNISVTANNECMYGSSSGITSVVATGVVSNCPIPVIEQVTPNTFQVGQVYSGRITITNSTSATVSGLPTGISSTGISHLSRSVLFNGTSSFLTVPTNTAFSFGTGDFTIECWVYFNSSTTYQLLAMLGDGVDAVPVQRLCSWALYYDSSGYLTFNRYAPAFVGATFSWSPSTKQWYHVALTRSGTNLRAFVNGAQIGSTITNSQDYSAVNSTSLHIGRFIAGGGINYYLNGHISNLRIVKGTAVYTSNFTPQLLSLQAISGTSLLTCRSDTIVDSSSNAFTITNNGASVSNFSPIGKSRSWLFNGANYLSTTLTGQALGTDDFTIEGWVLNTGSIYNNGIFHLSSAVLPNVVSGLALAYTTQAGGWTVYYGGTYVIYAATLSTNIWYHFALTRKSGTLRVYINGSQIGTNLADTTNYTGVSLAIGGYYSTGFLLTGYVSNFRIIRGTALYTSAFTPSTVPIAAIENTVLLTCNRDIISDMSVNNFTVTRVGTTLPVYSELSPFNGSNVYTFELANTPTVANENYSIRVSANIDCTIVNGAGSGTVIAGVGCPSTLADVTVTGSLTGGTVWGIGPYSTDSNVASAAVHAGLLAPGETGTIRRTPVGYLQTYGSNTQNGVTTTQWTSGWCGMTLSRV